MCPRIKLRKLSPILEVCVFLWHENYVTKTGRSPQDFKEAEQRTRENIAHGQTRIGSGGGGSSDPALCTSRLRGLIFNSGHMHLKYHAESRLPWMEGFPKALHAFAAIASSDQGALRSCP